jgi:hypothetical protein
MEFTSLNPGDNWLTIPTDKVIGSVSTTEELKTAITQLNADGFGQEEIAVLCGQEGASRLDVTGEQHGLLGRLYRFVEKFGDMDLKLLKDYEEELLGGHFVIAVDVNDDDERKRVTDILVSHGGHRVNFFGRWVIENLG